MTTDSSNREHLGRRLSIAWQEFVASDSALVRVTRLLIRFRYPVVLALALGLAIRDGLGYITERDPYLFTDAGLQLLSSDAINVYGREVVQVGPIHLVLHGLGGLIARLYDGHFKLPLAILVEVSFTLGVMFTVRLLLRDHNERFAPAAETLAGILVLIWSVAWGAYAFGQAAEAFVVLLWILTAIAATRDDHNAGGVTLGVAGAWKLHGLLGAPLLLLGRPPLLTLLRSGATAVATAVAPYLPFALFGRFNMFDFEWPVEPDFALRFLYGDGFFFTWQDRVVQSLLAMAAAAFIVVYGRGLSRLWAAPLALAAARSALDPLIWPWYWVGVETILVVGIVCLIGVRSHPWWLRLAWLLAAYVMTLGAGGRVWSFLALAYAIAVAVTDLGSEEPRRIEKDRDGAVVDELDVHHGSELSRLTGDA